MPTALDVLTLWPDAQIAEVIGFRQPELFEALGLRPSFRRSASADSNRMSLGLPRATRTTRGPGAGAPRTLLTRRGSGSRRG